VADDLGREAVAGMERTGRAGHLTRLST
jgi:hypothetical protein